LMPVYRLSRELTGNRKRKRSPGAAFLAIGQRD